MKVALFGKIASEESKAFIHEILEKLEHLGIDLIIYEPFYRQLQDLQILKAEARTFNDNNGLKGQVDFLFSIGGDGTLLDTITFVQNSGIPILGINLGRMGFLSSVSKDQIGSAFEQLLNNRFKLDERTLLKLITQANLFGQLNYAMNDISVNKKYPTSMLKIQTFVDDEFLNSYWADGLIIATPTGSTAYSMSSGGPIILPQSRSFVITPIATHNLTVRPVVIPDNCEIKIKIVGRITEFFVSLDSRSLPCDSNTELVVKKEDFIINLVHLNDASYFKTIREKLMWGLDFRN
jgi:NAD+ kinase